MGLLNASTAMESPPLHPHQSQSGQPAQQGQAGQVQQPTPPRSLSETTAATTLAYFKQQSPHPPPAPALPGPPPPHLPSHSHLPSQPQPPTYPLPLNDPFRPQDPSGNGHGHARKKQKYTIRNAEAWGERHGRPASLSSSGKALWKRPSDGLLVYLVCPVEGCGKADFGTLHGFMCHLTKKHKDRTLGSQSRALEVCGVVCADGVGAGTGIGMSGLGPGMGEEEDVKRASTETEDGRVDAEMQGQGQGSAAVGETKGYHPELEYSSLSNSEKEGEIRPLKTEPESDVRPPLSMHVPGREDAVNGMEREISPSRLSVPAGLEMSGLPSSRESRNGDGHDHGNGSGSGSANETPAPVPDTTQTEPARDPEAENTTPVQMEAMQTD